MIEEEEEAVRALLEAISLGRTDIVRALLGKVRSNLEDQGSEKAGMFQAFLDAPRNDVGSFIHIAAELGKQDILLALLQFGSDPSVLNSQGERILGAAAKSKGLDRLFLPAVLNAIAASNSLLVRQLLDAGVDANAVDSGRSLLHWAAKCGDGPTAKLLLDHGAAIGIVDSDGVTPLHDALKGRSEDVAGILIRAGADINAKAVSGPFQDCTPLDVIRNSDYNWSSSFLSQLPITNGYRQEEEENSELTEFAKEAKELHSNDFNEAQRPLPLKGHVSPLAPVITDERLNLLWPQPTLVKQLQGEPALFPEQLPLTVAPGRESVHKILDVFDLHRTRLKGMDRRIFLNEDCPIDDFFDDDESSSIIHCSVLRDSLHHVPGSYSLTVSSKKVRISCGDLSGLHYALNTLLQMFSLFKEEGLIPVVVTDQPQFAVRGVLLDMNPFGRVPKFDLLMQLIESLSYLKVNQVQAFVRLSRDSDWSFSFSKSDLLSIDRFCRERFISFIPAIDVDKSINTVDDLPNLGPKIRDVIKCFDSPKFLHIGPSLTSLLFSSVESNRLIKTLFSNTENLMVCGNSLAKNLKSSKLPTNLIALQYGFKMNSSFSASLSSYQDVGLGIGVCTGSFAWSNIAGSPTAMLTNVVAGHQSLAKHHGSVSIVAHWSSDPAFCHSIFAWPAFVTSAGLAWNPSTPLEYIDSVLEDLLNFHVVGDLSLPWGRLILDLGKAEYLIESRTPSSTRPASTSMVSSHNEESIFLQLLVSPDDVNLDGVAMENTSASIQQIRRVQSQLLSWSSTPGGHRLDSIRHELQLTSDLLLIAARTVKSLLVSGANPTHTGSSVVNCGMANLPPTFKTDMANKLLSLVEQYRALWLLRYHAPGLHGCLRTLSNLLKMFIPEGTDMIL